MPAEGCLTAINACGAPGQFEANLPAFLSAGIPAISMDSNKSGKSWGLLI